MSKVMVPIDSRGLACFDSNVESLTIFNFQDI